MVNQRSTYFFATIEMRMCSSLQWNAPIIKANGREKIFYRLKNKFLIEKNYLIKIVFIKSKPLTEK